MASNPPPPPEPKYVLRDGMGPVSCVEFGSLDTLYVGTQDGWIHVWDLSINRKRTSFQAGCSVCLALKVIVDKLIIQIKGEGINIHSIPKDYELLKKIDNTYVGFCRIEVDSILKVFIPNENAEIKAMNLDDYEIGKCFHCPADKLGELMAMKFMNYQLYNLLLVGYESGDMYLWDVLKGTRVSNFKIANVPMAIDFDEYRGKGVVGTESDSVIMFRVEANLSLHSEKSILITNPGVSSVIIRPDKKIMVLGCWDGNLRIFSWKSGRILGVLSEHSETVDALSYSSNAIKMWGSAVLAAGSKDRSVSLWSFF